MVVNFEEEGEVFDDLVIEATAVIRAEGLRNTVTAADIFVNKRSTL